MIDLYQPRLHGKATSLVSLISVGFGLLPKRIVVISMLTITSVRTEVNHIPTLLILFAVTSIALTVYLNLTVDPITHEAGQAHV
jgi:hypothetical protein